MQSMPNTWRMVKLGDLALPVERIDPRSKFPDTFNYIDISAVDNVSKRVVGNPSLNVSEAPSRARQAVYPGDVLVSTVRPGLNAVVMVPHNLLNTIASTGFCVLRPRSDMLLPGFLFHFVTTAPFVQSLVSRQKGGSYPAVSDNDILSISIPLPPLSEQQRIVEILQEVEEIRRLRAEAEAKTSELIPAMFAATFGDLYFGKSPFPVQPLSSIGELDRGKSRHRPRDEQSLYGGPYPFLQTGDVAQANGWITTYTQTYSEKGLEQSRLWPKGTLAITIAANIGSTAILTFDACFPDSVVGFTPNKGISAEYVRWWLLGYQKKLEIQAPQGAQKNINLEVLRSIQIPVPPPELQLKFQAEIQNIREQIGSNTAGTRTFAYLQSSISARAFSGQLTADWREAHRDKLTIEARERDAALNEAGAILLRSRLTMAEEIEELLQDRTDGIYADLNHEQRNLFCEIERMFGGVDYGRYFTAESLAADIKGPLHRHSQRIESHLVLFAARGLIIPVSQMRDYNTGPAFAACYRLPIAEKQAPNDEGDADAIGSDDIRGALMEAQRKLATGRI